MPNDVGAADSASKVIRTRMQLAANCRVSTNQLPNMIEPSSARCAELDTHCVVVAIPSAGRRAQLTETLRQLAKQQLVPSRVVVCTPDTADVDEREIASIPLRVEIIRSERGSCTQRNAILDALDASTEVVLFMDDDFYPAPDYTLHLLEIMRRYSDVAVLTSWPELDGAPGPGISHDVAVAAVEKMQTLPTGDYSLSDTYGGYGCNMSVRGSVIRSLNLRFDERLCLYGWLEDIDFSRRAAARGRVVGCKQLRGVHLGIKQGRTSGVRLGYSQIANPAYLVGKGTITRAYAAHQVARNVGKNLWRALWPEPWVDRRGRLKGNLIGLLQLIQGDIRPEEVTTLVSGGGPVSQTSPVERAR